MLPLEDDAVSAPAGAASTTVARHLPVGESVTRGALALLSTQPLTWGSSLLTTIVAPRLLGADALGQVTIAITVAALAATATSLGVSEFLVRRVAQQPATLRQDAGVALLVQTVTTLLGALIIAIVGPLGAFSLGDQRLLFAALLSMIITPAQTVLLSSFRGREQHKNYAWFNAAGVVGGQVGGVIALFLGADVVVYAAILGGAIIVATVGGWKLSGLRPSLPITTRELYRESREFIWGGLSFLTWNLTLSITSGIDRVLLGMFVPVGEVGWYAAAYRIIAIPIFIPTLIATPLFPALSRSVHEPATVRRTIASSVRVVLQLVVPLSAGIIVLAPAIPSLLGWPADFENSVPLLALLSLQLPIIGIDMMFGVVLMAIGRQGAWATVGILAAVLKIALNLVAIPLFESQTGNGAVGASIVTLVSELFMFVGAIVLVPKHLIDWRIALDIGRMALAGAAIVVVGSLLLPFGLVFAVAGGGIAYFASAFVLRALTMDDVRPLSDRLVARFVQR
jgi:O-antigen/teichoic acid export membrane protein